jgi:hypothetical protein
MTWELLCDVVSHIRVGLSSGKLVTLPRPAAAVLESTLAGGSVMKRHERSSPATPASYRAL